jgi:hydroxylaminobenzene mutase
MSIAKAGRQILIHGLAFMFVGLVWGLVVPKTPYPRLALGAHIQFEESGILFLVVAILLLKLPHRVGRKSMLVMLLAVWLTWLMVFSEVANAWWGTTQMLPIAAREAGAMGGTSWQELIVKLSHISAGLVLIVAWALLLIGFIKTPPATEVPLITNPPNPTRA